MPDLRALHRLYHACGYRGLRFELAWWQYVLAAGLLRLGARWHAKGHARMMRLLIED